MFIELNNHDIFCVQDEMTHYIPVIPFIVLLCSAQIKSCLTRGPHHEKSL